MIHVYAKKFCFDGWYRNREVLFLSCESYLVYWVIPYVMTRSIIVCHCRFRVMIFPPISSLGVSAHCFWSCSWELRNLICWRWKCRNGLSCHDRAILCSVLNRGQHITCVVIDRAPFEAISRHLFMIETSGSLSPYPWNSNGWGVVHADPAIKYRFYI